MTSKTVSARIKEDEASFMEALVNAGEIKNTADLVRLGLEHYRSRTSTIREDEVRYLKRRRASLLAEKAIALDKVDREFETRIVWMDNRLAEIYENQAGVSARVQALIPRWITTVRITKDLGWDPKIVLENRAEETPEELVEFFKPFNVDVTWSRLKAEYLIWEATQ